MKKILVSAISIVNPVKEGSEIYTTYAKRLINDVITKTPYDIMVSTNRLDLFDDIINQNNNRVKIKEVILGNHKTHVGAFNQLLKFYAMKDIDKNYEWLLYLDCDAGFTTDVDYTQIDNFIDVNEKLGFDMLGLRTDATYEWAENQFIESKKNNTYYNLFDRKFLFYGVNPEWRKAKLPSEHILLIKNDSRMESMCLEFEKFCTWFETQEPNRVITFDMESFEIGISSLISGYNMGEMGWGNQCEIFKVGFNFNNWEKIKR
jgi:lipopolysaccharide biosynthesis glycosyltransferase